MVTEGLKEDREGMGHVSAFCCCSKAPKTVNLKRDKVYLAHGFGGYSLAGLSIVSEPVVRLCNMMVCTRSCEAALKQKQSK